MQLKPTNQKINLLLKQMRINFNSWNYNFREFITNNWKPGHIGYHCCIELPVSKKLRPHILRCIERQPISTFILQKTLFSERHQFKIFEVFNVEFFRKTLGQKSSLTPSRWKLRPRNIFFFSPTKPQPINYTEIILSAIKNSVNKKINIIILYL